jgi:hypothetical protein
LYDSGTGTENDPYVPAGVTALAYTSYRNTALSSVKQQIKGSPGNIHGWNFINPNTTDVYVKIYDALVANVTVGTTVPVFTLCIPAAASASICGIFFQDVNSQPQFICTTGITIAAVTGLADNSTTAPSTAIHCSVRYV